MRYGLALPVVCLLLAPWGAGSQDVSQVSYQVQALQAEVRALDNRVRQIEVRQYDPRPREDARELDALRQQVARLEERVAQLEGRGPGPKAPPPKPAQEK